MILFLNELEEMRRQAKKKKKKKTKLKGREKNTIKKGLLEKWGEK
jgi:hypothetical protein